MLENKIYLDGEEASQEMIDNFVKNARGVEGLLNIRDARVSEQDDKIVDLKSEIRTLKCIIDHFGVFSELDNVLEYIEVIKRNSEMQVGV